MPDTLNNRPNDISMQGVSNRSSIDLSVELEHQLDSESVPPDSPIALKRSSAKSEANRTSLDPHVLAHIVTQLRDSLTHVSQERDDLVQQLAESHSREAEFKDSLALCTEQCASLEGKLVEQKKKNQEAEEAIVVLRSKVEESRRGLMRLQSERNAENKRMTLDLTHARSATFGGPRSSQRTSFTPLTGSGHPPPPSFRRTASMTVAENDSFADFVAGLPGGVAGQTLPVNENGDNGSSHRRSLLSVRTSGTLDGRVSPSTAELDALKRELAAVRAALEETRHELSDSNEAREASETCVKALREFIAESGAGDSAVQLPPLPSDLPVKDVEPEQKQRSTGWGGLKLWKIESSQAPGSNVAPAARASLDSHRTSSSEHESTPPSTMAPLRNKFGAFFTRKMSVSSVSHPLSQPNQGQPTSNGSDVSSSTEERSEPTSPVNEAVTPVIVREPPVQTAGARDVLPHEPGDDHTMKAVSSL